MTWRDKSLILLCLKPNGKGFFIKLSRHQLTKPHIELELFNLVFEFAGLGVSSMRRDQYPASVPSNGSGLPIPVNGSFDAASIRVLIRFKVFLSCPCQ